MFRIPHPYRLTPITFCLVLSLLLAPSLTLANCCCDLSRLTVGLGITQPHCCNTENNEQPIHCCSSPASTGDSANTHPVVVDCPCECGGCSAPEIVRFDVTVPTQDSLVLPDADSGLVILLAADEGGFLSSARLEACRASLSLSAPQRCATLCRWLN